MAIFETDAGHRGAAAHPDLGPVRPSRPIHWRSMHRGHISGGEPGWFSTLKMAATLMSRWTVGNAYRRGAAVEPAVIEAYPKRMPSSANVECLYLYSEAALMLAEGRVTWI